MMSVTSLTVVKKSLAAIFGNLQFLFLKLSFNVFRIKHITVKMNVPAANYL